MSKWNTAPLVEDTKPVKSSWQSVPIIEDKVTTTTSAPTPKRQPEIMPKKYVYPFAAPPKDKDFLTEEIPEMIKGAGERIGERFKRVEAPTVLGEKAKEVTGIEEGFGAKALETVAGFPERMGRKAVSTVSSLMEPIGVASEAVMKGVDNFLKNIPSDLINKAVQKGAESKEGQKIIRNATQWWSSLSEAEKANYGTLPDVLDMIGVKGGGKVAKEGLTKATRKGLLKGVGVDPKAKKTWAGFTAYLDKGDRAVKTIAENRNVVKLTDKFGESIPYPRSAEEMSKAIHDNMKHTYKEYHKLAVQAGHDADLDAYSIAIKLREKIHGPDKEMLSPEARQHAAKRLQEVLELDGKRPEIIEERLKTLNDAYNVLLTKTGDMEKARVDVSIANMIREQLDSKIEKATGGQYKKLKRQYGALKELEKQVSQKAAQRAAQTGVRLTDLTDIFTGRQLITGILFADPRSLVSGAGGIAIKEFLKRMGDPDKAIESMFKRVFQAAEQAPKRIGLPKAPVIKGIYRGIEDEEEEREIKYINGRPALPGR